MPGTKGAKGKNQRGLHILYHPGFKHKTTLIILSPAMRAGNWTRGPLIPSPFQSYDSMDVSDSFGPAESLSSVMP